MQYLFLCLAFLFTLFSLFILYKTKQIKIIKQHEQKQIDILNKEIEQLQSKANNLKQQCQNITEKKFILSQYLEAEKNSIEEKIKNYQFEVKKAANNYIDKYQKIYSQQELKYNNLKIVKINELNSVNKELQKMKDTRAAAYQAFLKEKQIKQNKENYSLIPKQSDLKDIHTLERIKKDLIKPRILSMLIWKTYWQPLAKQQFPIILQGSQTKMGIYKITNVINNLVYIGQSVDIYKRWCQHCKAGLGIDTPVGNKLYKAMQEYGLENFTFQLLCQCQRQQLDKKEKYFIELYQADTFGYNSTAGNK